MNVSISHQRIASLSNLTLIGAISFQTDSCRLQILHIVVQLHRASEVQISHHGTHGAQRCVVRILFDEVQRQYTLEHTHLVDVSVHHVRRGVLVNIGSTQCDMVTHDTCQTVSRERFNQLLVHIDIADVLRA